MLTIAHDNLMPQGNDFSLKPWLFKKHLKNTVKIGRTLHLLKHYNFYFKCLNFGLLNEFISMIKVIEVDS